MGQQRIFGLTAVAVAIGYIYSVGCGSATSGLTGTETTDSGGTGTAVTVSGTITMPGTSTSASLSKGLGAKVVEDVAAAGLEGTLYDAVTGDEVGTFTTDSAGAYTVECELEEHPEDSNASADDAIVTAQLALEADSADGLVHIETFVEVPIDPTNADDPITVNADTRSTIAAQAMRSQFGIAGWAAGSAAAFVQGDPFCFFQLQHEVFTNANLDGDGMADDLGTMQAIIDGAMASGSINPAALGYDNWAALMQATLGGDLPTTDADADGVADVLDTLATAAAATTGESADDLLSNYNDGLAAMAVLGTAFGDNMSNGSAAAANLAKGLHKTAAEGGESACDTITGSGDDAASYLDVLVESVVECEIEDGNCDEAYSDPEGMAVMIATLDEFLAADNWALADDLPFVLNGMLTTDSGNGFDEYFGADGTIDPTKIDGFYAVCGTFDPDLNEGQMEDWANAMMETIEVQGYQNIVDDSGTINQDYIEFLDGYYASILTAGAGTDEFGGTANIDYANTATFLLNDYTALGDDGAAFGDCYATTGDYMGCQGDSGSLTVYAADGSTEAITLEPMSTGGGYLSCYQDGGDLAACNTQFAGGSSSSSSSGGGSSSSSGGQDMATFCQSNPSDPTCAAYGGSSSSSSSSSSGGSSSSSSSSSSSGGFGSSSSSSSSGGFGSSSSSSSGGEFGSSSSSSSSGGSSSSSSSSSGGEFGSSSSSSSSGGFGSSSSSSGGFGSSSGGF